MTAFPSRCWRRIRKCLYEHHDVHTTLPQYLVTSRTEKHTVYCFANLTLSSDRTLTNTHFGLHFPEHHWSLTWVNQRGNCECRRAPAACCTSPELLRHYQSTHFLAQTMASSAPHIIRLRLDWSEVPLVGPLLLSNLTSDYQAPSIMPDFQQLSFILSNWSVEQKR